MAATIPITTPPSTPIAQRQARRPGVALRARVPAAINAEVDTIAQPVTVRPTKTGSLKVRRNVVRASAISVGAAIPIIALVPGKQRL